MYLSEDAIEEMGFRKYPESDELKIRFGIIKIYSLQGLVFEKDIDVKQTKIVPFDANAKLVISQSVNNGCKLLLDDEFIDDEAKFVSDKKTSPPFLLIFFREGQTRTLKGGYRQSKDGQIYTYNAFSDTTSEIRNWLNEVEPRIVSSLAVKFGTAAQRVDIVPVDQSVFGQTQENTTVINVTFSGHAVGYVTSARTVEHLNSTLDSAVRLFGDLDKNSIHHFYLAINEKDRLKGFLGFFFFIERLVNRTFKKIDHNERVEHFFNLQGRMGDASSEIVSTTFSGLRSLSQRFHWCVITVWGHLNDQDIKAFSELKKIRDRLAHGEHVNESDLPLEKARSLAVKLLDT
ncbi:MAG: hypothetical protein WD045_06945 [Pirellulaceae bacterium]